MNEHIDHAAGRMRVSGAAAEPEIVRDISHEQMQEIVAEHYAWSLVEALKAAVAGAPHWRTEAQTLLRLVDRGVLPEERPR